MTIPARGYPLPCWLPRSMKKFVGSQKCCSDLPQSSTSHLSDVFAALHCMYCYRRLQYLSLGIVEVPPAQNIQNLVQEVIAMNAPNMTGYSLAIMLTFMLFHVGISTTHLRSLSEPHSFDARDIEDRGFSSHQVQKVKPRQPNPVHEQIFCEFTPQKALVLLHQRKIALTVYTSNILKCRSCLLLSRTICPTQMEPVWKKQNHYSTLQQVTQ